MKSTLPPVIELLSVVLADHVKLYIKTKKFHWNIDGANLGLNKVFETQYNRLENSIDEVADHINKSGNTIIDSTLLCETLSVVKEERFTTYLTSQEMIQKLLDDHKILVSQLNKYADHCTEKHDTDTADFLKKLMEEHKTSAWTLTKYLN